MTAAMRIFQATAILFILGFVLGAVVPRILGFLPAVIGLLTIIGAVKAGHRDAVATYMHQNRMLFIFLFGIIILSGLSALWSIAPEVSVERSIKLLCLLPLGAFMALLWRFCREPFLHHSLLVIIGLWVVGLIIMNIELAFDLPLYRLIRGIDFSKDVNPSYVNRQLIFLCLIFFTLYPMFLEKSQLPAQTILKILIPLLTITALYMTKSQAAVLAFAVGGVFFLLVPYFNKYVWLGMKIFLAGAMLLTPWICIWAFETFASATMDNYEFLAQSNAALRLEIWETISRRALENPLIGFGVEATREISFTGAKEYMEKEELLHPHNFAAQIWIEFGIIGAALAAVFLWWFVSRVEVMPKALQRSAFPTLMATLLIAAITYGLWQGWWLGTFLWLTGSFGMLARFYTDRGIIPPTTHSRVSGNK